MKKTCLVLFVLLLASGTSIAGMVDEDTGNRIAETGTAIVNLVAQFAVLALLIVGLIKLIRYFRRLDNSITQMKQDISEVKESLAKQDNQKNT